MNPVKKVCGICGAWYMDNDDISDCICIICQSKNNEKPMCTSELSQKPFVIKVGHLGAGDLESKEKGSGARFNAGKIPYEYLPLTTLLRFLEREKIHCIFEASPRILLEILAQWQRRDVDIDNVLCAAIAGYGLESFADAAHVFKHVTERPINPYPTWNFAKGMKWSIPFGCAVRHTLREIAGHTHDEETGLPERGHTLCNLIMLLHYQTHYPEGDDRAEAGLL